MLSTHPFSLPIPRTAGENTEAHASVAVLRAGGMLSLSAAHMPLGLARMASHIRRASSSCCCRFSWRADTRREGEGEEGEEAGVAEGADAGEAEGEVGAEGQGTDPAAAATGVAAAGV